MFSVIMLVLKFLWRWFYLYGEVPCVRNLTKEEIDEAYEKNTGVLIADEFAIQNLDYIATPAVLCKNHGPFTWGKDAHEAVHNAVVLVLSVD